MMQVEVKINGVLIAVAKIVNKTAQEVDKFNNCILNESGNKLIEVDHLLKSRPDVCTYRVRFFDFSSEVDDSTHPLTVVNVKHDTRKHFSDLVGRVFTKLYNKT